MGALYSDLDADHAFRLHVANCILTNAARQVLSAWSKNKLGNGPALQPGTALAVQFPSAPAKVKTALPEQSQDTLLGLCLICTVDSPQQEAFIEAKQQKCISLLLQAC